MQLLDPPLRFDAPVVSGAGRGKEIGAPTMNLDLLFVPAELQPGVYACKVQFEDHTFIAAMHYGARPVFQDAPSCEVHVIGQRIDFAPAKLSVAVVAFLRPVMDFPSTQDLLDQIQKDVAQTQEIFSPDIV